MVRPLALAALLGLGLAGCATPRVYPPRGLLFSQGTSPITTDFHGTTLGSRTGYRTLHQVLVPDVPIELVLGIGPLSAGSGDVAVATAAREAGISTVRFVECERLVVLGVYRRYTFIVHGD
ncbi:MAG: hypothetical protein HY722_13525 [Planctomycetes bacterium]|nr:hypothetical protein [Planctomycetota bacterium]